MTVDLSEMIERRKRLLGSAYRLFYEQPVHIVRGEGVWLYDSEGNYRGRLSSNPYDPESTSNPYGRYGSAYSAESINNPYGAGSPYRADSPTNPYGTGWKIEGQGGVEASAHSAASEAPASAWSKPWQPADGSGSYSQTDSSGDIDTDF